MNDNSQLAGIFSSEESPKTSNIPFGIRSVFNFTSLDRYFLTNNTLQMEDFGRESLGIIDFNHPDFRRESLSFLHDTRNEDFGRESLGIIDLNSLDLGRESLGITSTQLPEIVLSGPKEDGITANSVLNTAFLMSSDSSSVSSVNSRNPSFNSASFDSIATSQISSILSSDKTNTMNDAFIDTSSFIKQLCQTSVSTIYSTLDKKIAGFNRDHRVHSLPLALEFERRFEHLKTDSAGQKTATEIEKRTHSSDTLNMKTETKNINFSEADEFNDAVFIEANHLASQIADGSIFDQDVFEDDMLDSIREPDDLVNLSDECNEEEKPNSEIVFKTVDKLLPPPPSELTEDHNSHCKNNESDGSGSHKSNNSKSKDANEILCTLSEILKNDNPSEQQKTEGQNLLSSLAEILSSGSIKSRSNSLDDSGHSSIENEPVIPQIYECYEVLDLRKKSSSETNIDQIESYEFCGPLDLSLKSKSINCEKAFANPKTLPLPPKFSNRSSLTDNASLRNNYSASSNESRNSSDLASKFKPKKNEEKLSRKGPMKAVIPVDNMAKTKKSLKLPKTPTDPKPSVYKLKKTSTPVNESNLKPMAQSTPDGPCLKPNNPKTNHPISPLARPKVCGNFSPKNIKQKLNYSGSSLLNTSGSQDSKSKIACLSRRRSGDDLKKRPPTEKMLVRSYSTGGRDPRLSSSLNKAKENVAKLQRSFSSNASVLKENKHKPAPRLSLEKRCGKENVAR